MAKLHFLLPATFALLLLAAACGNPGQNPDGAEAGQTKSGLPLLEGRWRATLSLTGGDLPFNFDLKADAGGRPLMEIINAGERIAVTDIRFSSDSVYITLPVYGSQIRGKINERRIFGEWVNPAYGEGAEPTGFYAVYGDSSRFQVGLLNGMPNVAGRWETVFIKDDKSGKTDAIGEFGQQGGRVTGTFLTPTGDFRFLEGAVNEEEVMLSCFDGAHAYLFKGRVAGEDIQGDFWSASGYHAIWLGFRNDTATLPNPYETMALAAGKDAVAFTLPNLEGNSVSLSDERYRGKVVLVQLLGTWCPNCRDETAFYVEQYGKYKNRGLEIIGLAFENAPGLAGAKPALERYKKHFGLEYELLYAGEADKAVASGIFPQLSEVTAFPTTLFIDREGRLRKVHTGFSGPATGGVYDAYRKSFGELVESLLEENAS